MQREQQAYPVRGPEAVDQQVGGLGDPVLRGGTGELDPGRAVDVGQQGLRQVPAPDQAGGQVVQGLSWAVVTGGAAVVVRVLAPGVGLTVDRVTFCAPL